MKIDQFTPKEREMLRRAAMLVLAGEWPWDEKAQAREQKVLERAAEKLRGTLSAIGGKDG